MYIKLLDDIYVEHVTRYVSFFLDEFPLTTIISHGFRQAMELLPEHVFIDDGDEDTLRSAFESYRFCASAEFWRVLGHI